MEKIFTQNTHHLTVDYITKKTGIKQRSLMMQQILAKFYDRGLFEFSESEAIEPIASVCNWSKKGINRIIKEKLFKASRIQDFLDSIRESLINHGTIRRSPIYPSGREK